MKLHIHLVTLLLALSSAPTAFAATPDAVKTLDYIHRAWPTLTRRMNDYSAFGNGPVDTQLAVYLPMRLPMPADLPRIAKACHVEVHRLLQSIRELGSFDPATLPVQGLHYLPHPYVVPGVAAMPLYQAPHRLALARRPYSFLRSGPSSPRCPAPTRRTSASAARSRPRGP